MKRISLFLLAAFSCLTLFGATYGTCGANLKWSYDTNSKTLTITGSGPMGDYSSSYNSSTKQTTYTTPWKDFHEEIVTVIISNGVTSIGDNAFVNDKALKNCQIAGSVTSIGRSAFSKTGLEKMELPEGVQKVSRYAFSQNYELKHLYIPASVTDLAGWFAFACSYILDFQVSPNNPNYCSVGGVLFDKSMKTLIFYPVGNPATTYNIPEGVEVIEEIAFYRAENLRSVTFPSSLKTIKHSAFEYSKNLESVDIPGSVSRIEHETFGSCYKLSDVSLHECLTYIGEEAFDYCKELSVVEITRTVTEIHKDAFKNSPNVQLRKGVSRAGSVAKASAPAAAQGTRATTQTRSKSSADTYGGRITQHRGLAPWTGVVGSGVYY